MKLWEQYLQENNEQEFSKIKSNIDRIYNEQEIWYRRGKCSEFRSLFSKEGRIKFSICAARAKIHGIRKVLEYLKTIKTTDSHLRDTIQKTILMANNTIKVTTRSIQRYEKETGIDSSHYDTDKASGIYQNLINRR